MDTDAVTEQSDRLDSMKTVEEVFGPDNAEPFMTLSWAGRDENAAGIARRLQPSLKLIADRYPVESVHWYVATPDIQSELAPVPTEDEALTAYVDSTFERPWGESNAWTTISLELKASSLQKAPALASLNVRAGTMDPKMNAVILDLSPNFPMGTPAQAAEWFLELVRIWQPDSALFTTQATVDEVDFGKTHAAYLAWISSVRGTEPDIDHEIRIPYGDGTLHVARTWSIAEIRQSNEELLAGGARSVIDMPAVQSVPQLPAVTARRADSNRRERQEGIAEIIRQVMMDDSPLLEELEDS